MGIRKIIDAIKDGFAGPELKVEMDQLQTRKESLLAQLRLKMRRGRSSAISDCK